MRRRRYFALVIVTALSVLAPARSIAAPGGLDPSFGSGGVVTTNFGTTPGPTSHDYGRGVVVNPDGSLVVVGSIETSDGAKSFGLAKYSAAGVLDATFGSSGKTITSFANATATAAAAVRQQDGKIVVAGSVVPAAGNGAVALARYTPAGVLDGSFGTGGRVTTDLSSGPDYASGVAIQQDGKLVVSATSGTSFAVLRYNADGSPDASFGTSGRTITAFSGLQADAATAVLQPDGGIVLAGTVDDGLSAFDMAVARYTPTGVLDATFGAGGTAVVDVAGGYDFAYAALALPDGKIVLAGQADVGQSTRMALVRLTAAGAIDSAFGTSGKTTTTFADLYGNSPYAIASIAAVTVQGGRIVAAGYAGAAGYEFALARYSMNGVLDATFGNAGRVVTNLGGFDDEVRAVVAQPDGRIVAAGQSYQGSYDFAVVRYGITYASGADVYPVLSATDAILGSTITIAATARNDGPDPAANATLTVGLPAASTFQSAVPSQGSCVHSSGTVTCQLGTLAPGDATVQITAAATGVGTLLTSASTASATPDPYAGNATTTAASRIRGAATSYETPKFTQTIVKDGLSTSKASVSGSAQAGGSLVADTAASSETPAGTSANGIHLGHASATGVAQVFKSFPAAGPVFTVSAVVTSTSQTVAGVTAPRIAGYRDGAATVHAGVTVWFYPCASTTQCAASASASNGLVVSQPGISRPSVTVPVTLRPPAFSGTGLLVVTASLTSRSAAYGECSSYARTTGSVAQITVS